MLMRLRRDQGSTLRVRLARSLALLALLLTAASGRTFAAPIAFVQSNSATPLSSSQSTVTVTFTAAQTLGNLNVVVVGWNDSTSTISGVTDSRGNSYAPAAAPVVQSATASQAIYYAKNIFAAATGANTVTVSFNVGARFPDIRIAEYSGLDTVNPLDVSVGAQGTTTSTSNSGSVTTTTANDLLVGANLVQSTTTAAGSGYTSRTITQDGDILEDRVVTVTGSYSATAALDKIQPWIMQIVAFRAAGSGTPAPSITSLNPTSGAVGTSITITGANFGASQGTSTVTFNGIVVTPGSWSTTSISVTVPASLATGSTNVVVTVTNVASNGATFTVTAPPAILVMVTPVRGGLTITQPLSVTAAVQNDPSNAGVSWTASGGMLSNMTNLSATFTVTSPGVYTITGTSKADVTKSASAVIGVTDLSGVRTWRNDNSRSGVNSQEYALTPQNVSTGTFGKLFSCAVDGQVFAQPLWVANVSVGGTQHNVVLVATENDSLYAFDADGPGCKPVWAKASVSLIPSGEVIVPFADLQNDNALGPVVGITGTPVIDPVSQTIYLVALTEDSGRHVIQRLHAIDITTGLERSGSPQVISASVTGAAGYDNSNGIISFAPNFEKQRPALLLLNGVIYISWAGFLDTDFYHGWLIGYDATTLAQVPGAVFNTTPNHVGTVSYSRGGIWMGGGAPAADSSGNLYFLTGNGTFDAASGGSNYGDSTMKLSTTAGLSVADWFTPADQASLDGADNDHGSGGAAILVDQPTSPVQHLVIGGGKEGNLFLLNRDAMGRYGANANPLNSNAVQIFSVGNGIFSTSAFWNNSLYIAPAGGRLQAYPFSTSAGQFNAGSATSAGVSFGFPGATPSISSSGASANGIVWATDSSMFCTPQSPGCGPAVLHAFDATKLSTELWNSSQAASDKAGFAVKFTVPTVANGKVYIGTRGNDTGTGTSSILGELDVYGLKPN